MKTIEQFDNYKKDIDRIYIEKLGMFEVNRILYFPVYRMIKMSKRAKLIRAISIIPFDTIAIKRENDYDSDSKYSAIEILYGGVPRADHKQIFNNIFRYLRPAKHVSILKKYQLNILKIFTNIALLHEFSHEMMCFDMIDRIYLSSQLVIVYKMIDKLKKIELFDRVSYLLLFQEADHLSNAIIQFAQSKGVKVISPQHGTPMNRHEDIDHLLFVNCICDYKLLWSDFEKEQYLSAGIDKCHLIVVGNSKEMDDDQSPIISSPNRKKIGVVLDGTTYDGAIEHNIELLKIAARLSMDKSFQLLIKVHPVDSPEKYIKTLNEVGFDNYEIIKGKSMKEYMKLIDFSLGCTSGGIFDLIYFGSFVFIYKTETKFPINIGDIYEFHNYDELKEKYEQWLTNINDYMQSYEECVKRFHIQNPKTLHDMFFSDLLNERKPK